MDWNIYNAKWVLKTIENPRVDPYSLLIGVLLEPLPTAKNNPKSIGCSQAVSLGATVETEPEYTGA